MSIGHVFKMRWNCRLTTDQMKMMARGYNERGRQLRRPLFVALSKIDHATRTERGHIRLMVPKSKKLTREEFASLLKVGNTTVLEPPAVIPAEHSARLIGLGYMMDLSGRLRMTTPGRSRIAAGLRKQVGAQIAN
jgi:hypothetical protein